MSFGIFPAAPLIGLDVVVAVAVLINDPGVLHQRARAAVQAGAALAQGAAPMLPLLFGLGSVTGSAGTGRTAWCASPCPRHPSAPS